MSNTPMVSLINFLRYLKRKIIPTNLGWRGNYKSWEEAEKKSKGYNQSAILEKVKNAALMVKDGKASYERDSVLFYKEKTDKELVGALLETAANKNTLRVIDIGGSLGSTYYQNRKALSNTVQLDWNIVEQKHYVDCGRNFFEETGLHYYYTIEDAMEKGSADVLLAACMLQYISEPYVWLQRFIDSGIPNILVERTGFIMNEEDVLTVQTVPPSIYEASYPCWFFKEENIISFFQERNFELVRNWDDSINIPITVNNAKAYWRSFLFRKIGGS